MRSFIGVGVQEFLDAIDLLKSGIDSRPAKLRQDEEAEELKIVNQVLLFPV